MCERISAQVPVVLMVYVNVVLAAGPEAFALRAAAAGAAGLIVPDLPHDEADDVRAACDAEGLALVPLVAPTTTPERVAAIGASARGFVYTVSLTGITGERDELPPRLTETVSGFAAATSVPVAVGFGISTAGAGGRGGRAGGRRDRGQPDRASRRRGRGRGGRTVVGELAEALR